MNLVGKWHSRDFILVLCLQRSPSSHHQANTMWEVQAGSQSGMTVVLHLGKNNSLICRHLEDHRLKSKNKACFLTEHILSDESNFSLALRGSSRLCGVSVGPGRASLWVEIPLSSLDRCLWDLLLGWRPFSQLLSSWSPALGNMAQGNETWKLQRG